MMGSGERGASICFTTLPGRTRQTLDSQRDHLAHRPHGNDPVIALAGEAVVIIPPPVVRCSAAKPHHRLRRRL